MISALLNSFKIPELKKRILITLALLTVYRIGCYIPTPGINGAALRELFNRVMSSEGGALFGIMNMFSGGAMSRMTIFALGIMPYISCSIIMQLLAAVIPALEKLTKEGRAGQQKITQITRYGTVALAAIQSLFVAMWIEGLGRSENIGIITMPGWGFRLVTILTLTTGTIFIMWLGEQIQERGIGQGISLIITAGIISRIPSAGHQLWILFSPYAPSKRTLDPHVFFIMLFLLAAVILAVTMIIQSQRRIPVQYARRVVGRKVYGGQSTYIPLKMDQSGIIAIIFAQSMILFPATIASFIPSQGFKNFAEMLTRGHWMYSGIYALLIIFFCYFYTAIVFNPLDISENLKKYGGFIPGIRPGRPTAEYLDYVMTRLTLAGAIFMAFIAIFPDFVMAWLKIPYLVASFFGGTGLLITIGVMLDTIKQIESHLLMRNYEGFLKSTKIKGRK